MKSSVVEQVLHLEGEKLLAAAHPPLIALDRQGESLSIPGNWQNSYKIGMMAAKAPVC